MCTYENLNELMQFLNDQVRCQSISYPLAHGGAPAHDAGLQPGVGSHPRSPQHGAALDPHPILQHYPCAQSHVGSDGAVLPDLSGRVLPRGMAQQNSAVHKKK